MKKVVFAASSLILALSLALAGCGKSGGDKAAASDTPAKKELSGEITVWGTSPDDKSIPTFQKAFPKVKVNGVKMDDSTGAALTAISAGQGGPDVVIYPVGNLSKFNNIAGVEDLLQPPYDAIKYKNDIVANIWEEHLSVDGKKLVGWPWDAPPLVAYFRADLFEANGLESDPAALSTLLDDPETFFSYAQKFKAAGISMYGSDRELVDITVRGIGAFDRKLNWVRSSPKVVTGLDLAKRSKQLKIGNDGGFNIWWGAGKEAVKQGKYAFINLVGSWFTNDCCLPNMASPDQKGKWKVTRSPLGNYGRDGGTTMSILSMSKNKEAAWEFVKWKTVSQNAKEGYTKGGGMSSYKPFWTLPEYDAFRDPWLGEQPAAKMYLSLIEKIPAVVRTVMDGKADEIWNKAIDEDIAKGGDSTADLKKIEEDVMKAVKTDRENLLRVMNPGS